jgi:anaerobic ribonucleoside-triphosphate reductase activating protein
MGVVSARESMAHVLNVAYTAPRSSIYGPGERFVIWVQGCSIRCKGCWSQDTWSPKPRELVRVDELWEQIVAERDGEYGLDGVTILGGEPMEQAEVLVELAQWVKGGGLGLMVYTGYDLAELTEPPQQRLVELAEILVPGRYVEELRDTGLRWRGSTNQQFLSGSAAKAVEELSEVEVVVAASGSMEVRGYPVGRLLIGTGGGE